MRRRGTVPIACAFLLVAGGCGMVNQAVSPSQVTPSASQDPLGVVTIAPGEPIVLGTLLTSSGPAADLGIDSLRGVKLALDYLDLAFDGKPGMLLGHPVVLLSRQDGCSETGGQRGARALAQDRQVVAVVGPTCSASALGGAARVLSHAGIVTISPSATNPRLTDPGQHAALFLRTAYNELTEGTAAADFSYTSLKARTGVTAYEPDPQGDAATTGFRERFEQLGGLITGSFAIPGDVAQAHPLLQAIGGGHTDVLYTTSAGERCAELAHVWAGLASTASTVFLGGGGCMLPSLASASVGQIRPSYVVGPDLTRMAQGSFYRTQFLPAYESEFGSAPLGPYHAYAFDATDILLDAIQVAAKRYQDGTLTIGRTALSDAVFATKDYQGLTGTLSCTPSGECSTDPAIAVYQLPAVPLEYGEPTAKPVFSESVSLQSLQATPTP